VTWLSRHWSVPRPTRPATVTHPITPPVTPLDLPDTRHSHIPLSVIRYPPTRHVVNSLCSNTLVRNRVGSVVCDRSVPLLSSLSRLTYRVCGLGLGLVVTPRLSLLLLSLPCVSVCADSRRFRGVTPPAKKLTVPWFVSRLSITQWILTFIISPVDQCSVARTDVPTTRHTPHERRTPTDTTPCGGGPSILPLHVRPRHNHNPRERPRAAT
jgi:hypothetical protein